MSVFKVNNPRGQVINFNNEVTASISDEAGFAIVHSVGHGLGAGTAIYIVSKYSNYNGYFYVSDSPISGASADDFVIRRSTSGSIPRAAYVQDADIVYYTRHVYCDWSCVHLPIMYTLSNNLWPANSADTIRTVSSISNDAGYVNLNLSGDIKATGSAAELEFVQVFGQNAGIYQILNWISDSDITIDFPYDAGVSFAASTVQYYYKDYHIRVKIYAGLITTHFFYEQNPIEEVGELRLVPDEDNLVWFNIADFVKSKIQTDKNDSSAPTLPNDINSWCHFYIEYADSYTYSNGYSLATFVGTFGAGDSFTGVAVNAKLPFKSIDAGFLSEYITDQSSTTLRAKFLSTMREPEMFQNQFYDISFIISFPNGAGEYILEQYLSGDTVVASSATVVSPIVLPDTNEGVFRHKLTYDSAYTGVRVSLYDAGSNQLMTEVKEIKFNHDCSSYYTDVVWKNHLGGHDYWRFNAGAQLSFQSKKEETETNIFTNYPISYGAFADTINKNSSVKTKRNYLLRSQYVTNQQAEDIISGIESALLVQVQSSQTDRRTILVTSSNSLEQTDKLKEIQLRVQYTDDVPTQSL